MSGALTGGHGRRLASIEGGHGLEFGGYAGCLPGGRWCSRLLGARGVKRFRMKPNAIGLLAILGMVAAFSPTAAQAATSIAWQAPAECPGQPDVVQGVERWIGAAITEPRSQELAISGRVLGGAVYAVTIEIVSNEGRSERYLEHADCARLVEAAQLVIAIAIAPEQVKRRQLALQPENTEGAPVGPSRTNPTTPVAAAQPARESPQPGHARVPEARRPAKEAGDQSRWLLSAAGLLGGGTLPNIGAGAEAELAFELLALRAGIVGSYWLARDINVPAARPVALNLELASAGLEVCGAWRLVGAKWGPCARAELGRMSGSGIGVDNARAAHARWSALSLNAAVRYPDSTRLAARLLAGGGLQLDRPAFGVTRAGVTENVFQSRDAFWRCALGLELRL